MWIVERWVSEKVRLEDSLAFWNFSVTRWRRGAGRSRMVLLAIVDDWTFNDGKDV